MSRTDDRFNRQKNIKRNVTLRFYYTPNIENEANCIAPSILHRAKYNKPVIATVGKVRFIAEERTFEVALTLHFKHSHIGDGVGIPLKTA